MMNVHQLIELVSLRPALWDRKDPKNQSKHVADKCWREISAEMEEDEYKLRKKWKYLRDQFPVELGKAAHQSEENPGTKWPYFRSLMFLKDSVKPRRYGRQQDHKAGSSTRNDNDESETNEDTEQSEETKAVKRRLEEEEDEHLYFFKSLIPHVRKIPPHKLLSFRSSIQSTVEQYAYSQEVMPMPSYENTQYGVCDSPELMVKREKLSET